MTYGLLCAFSWGISTFLAALGAKHIGALRTLVLGEVAGLTLFGTIFLAGHFSLRGVGPFIWLLAACGLVNVAGYLALYRGLEFGHVGLVSAISACYGGIIALLSVLVLGERLSSLASAGVVVTVAGITLAMARRSRAGQTQATGAAASLTFGLLAAACYGLSGFLIGKLAFNLGWLVPVLVVRCTGMLVLLGLLGTPLSRPGGGRTRPGVAWALAAGVFDAVGLLLFTRGDEVGMVAVTGAVSSAYPIIPLIGGLLLFRERMDRRQLGGAALLLLGLALLGVGS